MVFKLILSARGGATFHPMSALNLNTFVKLKYITPQRQNIPRPQPAERAAAICRDGETQIVSIYDRLNPGDGRHQQIIKRQEIRGDDLQGLDLEVGSSTHCVILESRRIRI
jgi:hypothetical protein